MKTSLFIALVASSAPALAAPLSCTTVMGLAVDADGAPNSYLLDGRGLSSTCDGVFAVVDGVPQTQKNNRNWRQLCAQNWQKANETGDFSLVHIVGFETNEVTGRPIVQGRGDPFPGRAYVSTTTLSIPGTTAGTQRHYVNASEIPYVVLSKAYATGYKLGLGDLVAVFRPSTRKTAYGVYADCCSVGEASVRLHYDLGNDPIVTQADGTRRARRGIGDKVILIALTGVHTKPSIDAVAWRNEIKTKGEAAFPSNSAVAAVNACK